MSYLEDEINLNFFAFLLKNQIITLSLRRLINKVGGPPAFY